MISPVDGIHRDPYGPLTVSTITYPVDRLSGPALYRHKEPIPESDELSEEELQALTDDPTVHHTFAASFEVGEDTPLYSDNPLLSRRHWKIECWRDSPLIVNSEENLGRGSEFLEKQLQLLDVESASYPHTNKRYLPDLEELTLVGDDPLDLVQRLESGYAFRDLSLKINSISDFRYTLESLTQHPETIQALRSIPGLRSLHLSSNAVDLEALP